MNPKLSIVIITRNQPNELKSILGGVQTRTFVDAGVPLEVIVVDDNSDTDEQFANMQLVSNFHARTGLGLYDYLTSRRLPGGARNRGLELATGEYVWIADGDDLIEWSAVPAIVDELKARSRIPLLMLDYQTVTPDGSVETISFAGGKLKAWECGVMAWHKVIRRDLYGKFREGVYSEDIDWWMRQCLEREIDFYRAPGIVGYTYRRLAPGSITSTGADRTDGRNLRILDEIRTITDQARQLGRPQAFIDHLIWLFNQYDEGKV